MENKLKVWIARDEDGGLYIYFIHPLKRKGEWRLLDFHNEDGVGAKRIDSNLFPSVQWEDEEPTEAYITLAEPQSEKEQPQSKQEQKIDWAEYLNKIQADAATELGIRLPLPEDQEYDQFIEMYNNATY